MELRGRNELGGVCVCVCVCVCVLVAQLCLTLAVSWTSLPIRIAHQMSLSIEFPRQEYWSG